MTDPLGGTAPLRPHSTKIRAVVPLDAGIRDPETGLYSRVYFDEVIGRELERAKRHGSALSVVSVVLDLGDLETDCDRETALDVLAVAGRVLAAITRDTDLVFRWERDELLVLLFEADATACQKKTEMLNALFGDWREGKGPVARPVRIGIGAGALEEGRVFAGVLQAARATARRAV
jgi:diguanylate cyclase (GGDEF)-like protein